MSLGAEVPSSRVSHSEVINDSSIAGLLNKTNHFQDISLLEKKSRLFGFLSSVFISGSLFSRFLRVATAHKARMQNRASGMNLRTRM